MCHHIGMIPRYSLAEMARPWSDRHKLDVWRRVEELALAAWVDLGVAPIEALEALKIAATPTPEEVVERERITNHDLAAFVDLLAEGSTIGGEWIHFGLTSSDVLDTALGVIMGQAADLLIIESTRLAETIRRRALEHRDTVMLGRTHGIWAEPTAFGLKLATWVFELERDIARLVAARRSVAIGKISGAVGTYAHTPPSVEEYVCSQLGIGIEPASSQVTHRDRHAEFLSSIALTGASIERFATEIRHLQRSEVGEVREAFASGQKGSSAMPHKRNPITSERMTGMARLLRGYAQVGLENVALWHERDISHSSAERVVLPDACLTLHYMLVTFERLVDRLEVDTARMTANLASTRGLVCSQAVLLALVEHGLARDDAYRIVQRNAMRCWDEGGSLQQLLAGDPAVPLSPEALSACFLPQRFLANTSVVFDRLEAIAFDQPAERAADG